MGKAIADSEWVLTAVFETKGHQVGHPVVMRYADSVVANGWENVTRLVAGRLDEARARFAPQAKRAQ